MLPREIRTENWPDRARYDLPLRPLGKLRLAGLPLIAFGILFAWSPGKQVWALIREVAEGRAGGGDWFIGGFTFLFVLAALLPFGMGMFVFMGRTRIVIDSKWIRVTECAGPFRWPRRVRCDSVVGLEVAHARKLAEGADVPGGQMPTLPGGLMTIGVLVAKKRFGKPALLLLGYPRDWIEPFAAELSEVLRGFGQKVPVREAQLPAVPAGLTVQEGTRERPAGTDIQVTENSGGLEMRVPSRGLFKQSYGLFVFGLLWSLMAAGFSIVFLRESGGGVEKFLVMGLFLIIGFVMTGLGLHLGTSRWTLKADIAGLEIIRRSALKTRVWSWRSSEIARLQVGRSGVEVNDRSLDELQVHPANGKKVGFMAGRSADELGWMAFCLKKALKLQEAGQGA